MPWPNLDAVVSRNAITVVNNPPPGSRLNGRRHSELIARKRRKEGEVLVGNYMYLRTFISVGEIFFREFNILHELVELSESESAIWTTLLYVIVWATSCITNYIISVISNS